MSTEPDESKLVELRAAALAAMNEGYYGDYIIAVVRTVLFYNKAIMNPDDERVDRDYTPSK